LLCTELLHDIAKNNFDPIRTQALCDFVRKKIAKANYKEVVAVQQFIELDRHSFTFKNRVQNQKPYPVYSENDLTAIKEIHGRNSKSNVDQGDPVFGHSPLHVAVLVRDIGFIRDLCAKKADIHNLNKANVN
jgi:hypothetical protein